jgi:hypothetical protein
MLPSVATGLRLALLGSALATGWWLGAGRVQARWDAAELQRERAVVTLAAQETRRQARINEDLTANRLRSERAAAGAAERLRQLAASAPDPTPACPGRADDTRPAAWLLRDADREDLVALARDADAVSDRLRACQRQLSDQ